MGNDDEYDFDFSDEGIDEKKGQVNTEAKNLINADKKGNNLLD